MTQTRIEPLAQKPTALIIFTILFLFPSMLPTPRLGHIRKINYQDCFDISNLIIVLGKPRQVFSDLTVGDLDDERWVSSTTIMELSVWGMCRYFGPRLG